MSSSSDEGIVQTWIPLTEVSGYDSFDFDCDSSVLVFCKHDEKLEPK